MLIRYRSGVTLSVFHSVRPFIDSIALAVGRAAPEGWPAQLSNRWLEELFGDMARGLPIAMPPLPRAIGASSFARALAIFGRAFRVAGASKSLPFVVARSPAFVDSERYANVFADLAGSTAFQRRALGLSTRVAPAQTRVLAYSMFIGARLSAVRLLLGDPDVPATPDLFDETTSALFGVPAPRALCGAWPTPRDDEHARFLGLLTAEPLARELRERYDEDWFQNPRAAQHLRARASGPAAENEVDAPKLAESARTLARQFESVLG